MKTKTIAQGMMISMIASVFTGMFPGWFVFINILSMLFFSVAAIVRLFKLAKRYE